MCTEIDAPVTLYFITYQAKRIFNHNTMQEYIRRGKESVILHIAARKCTLKSAKVKLCNITLNIPLTSGTVTTSMLVFKTHKLRMLNVACIYVYGHHLHAYVHVQCTCGDYIA